jgi:hypothetical protein
MSPHWPCLSSMLAGSCKALLAQKATPQKIGLALHSTYRHWQTLHCLLQNTGARCRDGYDDLRSGE